MTKRYSELVRFRTFEERFIYLKIGGNVGQETFGFDRFVNQKFYRSREWKDIRDFVIIRDEGCDLGVVGYEISVNPIIHHMNPMNIDDIVHNHDWILDPEFLILTTHNTHNAIHYGTDNPYPKIVTERTPRDTKLW